MERGYSLIGCTVSPGLDFRDWELADRNTLLSEYPQHANLICKFTRATKDSDETDN